MEKLDQLLAPPEGPTPKATMVVFGATGDLVTDHGVRKALDDLVTQGDLQVGRQKLIFTSRREVKAQDFLADVREGDEGDPPICPEAMEKIFELGGFESGDDHLTIVDLGTSSAFENLPAFKDDEVVVFYAALPPSAYEELIDRLSESGLMAPLNTRRLVLEKPFGEDRAAAERLARKVKDAFSPSQVYLVDHFLEYPGMLEWLSLRGKPAVDEALCMEFVCPKKGVHVRLEETILSNDRAYFRETGITEDMLQNHAMQILACSCMSFSETADAQSWRESRRAVVEALRWDKDEAVKAQVEGFNEVEKGAPEKAKPSDAETFASIAFHLDLKRWQGIPMRMTAGKGVSNNRFGVDVHLRAIPKALADEVGVEPNLEACLEITVNRARFELVVGGERFTLNPPRSQPRRPAYSRVFLDALHGAQAFFVDPAESVAAWRFIDEVQTYWEKESKQQPTYPAGKSVDELLG